MSKCELINFLVLRKKLYHLFVDVIPLVHVFFVLTFLRVVKVLIDFWCFFFIVRLIDEMNFNNFQIVIFIK